MRTRYLSAAISLAVAAIATAPVPLAAQETAANPVAAVAIPDTPAGRFMKTFLDAYNSADAAKLELYNRVYGRKTPPQTWIDMFAMTGRLTPVRVTSVEPNRITVLLAADRGDAFWQDVVSIDPADPMKIVEVALRTVERPPEFAIPRVARATLDAAMTRKLAEDVGTDRFAGTIIVQRHGKTIYQHAAGMADRAARLPVAMDTKFRIGSANKMFTAIAILQLVDEGKIALDANVGTYIPDYPNADFAKTVTIRQLLSHTGGAGDIFTPEYEAKRLETKSLADYVTLFGNRAPDTSKDGRTTYANYGFVLLGRIVEVVSGEDYYAYVQRHVFEPAGMNDTASLPENVAVPRRSRGYMKGQGGRLSDNIDTLPYRGSAAGGGYTTAADMIRFGNALLRGKLLSPGTLALATSPQHPDGWYGLGFWMEGDGPTRRWGHGGGAPGMNAAFRVYPGLDAVIVALANLDPLAADDAADFYANRMALKE